MLCTTVAAPKSRLTEVQLDVAEQTSCRRRRRRLKGASNAVQRYAFSALGADEEGQGLVSRQLAYT